MNPEKLFPKRKGIQAWIIGVAVSAGLLLLLLLIILLWWVSITLICQYKSTSLDCRGNCLSGTTFTFPHHSVMVGEYHTDMSVKVYKPGL